MSNDTQDLKKKSKEAAATEGTSKAEDYMKKNRRMILICLIALIAAVGGVLLYRNAYRLPHRAEAEEQIFRAEQLFERDSFELALKGNGSDIKGFLDIIGDYGNTPAGNVAHAYAGVCYYRLGDYESAIRELDKYSAKDIMLQPSVLGLIGDCYVETDKYDKAVGYFEDAAKRADNLLLSPVYLIKAGLAYEALGSADKAEEVYTRVKETYPASPSAATAEKYLRTLLLKSK